MKWNDFTSKELVTHIVSGVLLLFGMTIVSAGFIVPPSGEVHDSILWIFGEVLVFGGAVLGISLHIDNSAKIIEQRVLKKIRERIK